MKMWHREQPLSGSDCATCPWTDRRARTGRSARRHAAENPGHHARYLVEKTYNYQEAGPAGAI